MSKTAKIVLKEIKDIHQNVLKDNLELLKDYDANFVKNVRLFYEEEVKAYSVQNSLLPGALSGAELDESTANIIYRYERKIAELAFWKVFL